MILSLVAYESLMVQPEGMPSQVTVFVSVGILLETPSGSNPVTGLPSGRYAMSFDQSAGASVSYMKSWVMVRFGSSSAVHLYSKRSENPSFRTPVHPLTKW